MKRSVKLFAALLAAFWIFCGFSLPSDITCASLSSSLKVDDYPVYALVFESREHKVLTTAFLLRETTLSDQHTYLITTNTSSYLLDQGYTVRLIGPDFDTQARFLGAQGCFAFYDAPGLSRRPALTRATALESNLVMMTPELSGDAFTGWKKEVYNTAKWRQFDPDLMISDLSMPESLAFGALVYQGDGVVGCATQADEGHLAFSTFTDLKFPQEFSLEAAGQPAYLSGAWSTEKTQFTGRSTCPFLLDIAVRNCLEFTVDYELKSAEQGSFELYVRTTEGKWANLQTFTMQTSKTSVTVKPDTPISFDAVAVVPSSRGTTIDAASIGIRDVVTK